MDENRDKPRARKSARELHAKAQDSFKNTPDLRLGKASAYSYVHDPKHLGFVLARYKFCAKMLQAKERVIEVGGGDGIGLAVVAEAVGHLTMVDWDETQLDDVKKRQAHLSNVSYLLHDMNQSAPPITADAAYMVDVIEHLEPKREADFMKNIIACLEPHGVLIMGTPNITAESYATAASRTCHINLKSHDHLREMMAGYFHNVFLFGMNDEVLHTGYAPMCHYLWAIGSDRRDR